MGSIKKFDSFWLINYVVGSWLYLFFFGYEFGSLVYIILGFMVLV